VIKSLESFDFQESFQFYETHCKSLTDSRIVITGASGFIGNWLVETLIQISREFEVNYELVLLSRNERKLRDQLSESFPSNIQIFEIDIARESRSIGQATHIIHTATPTNPTAVSESSVLDASYNGALNIIESISDTVQMPIFLNLSSGAVYGKQGLESKHQSLSYQTHLSEDEQNFGDQYMNAKILTEEMIKAKTLEKRVLGVNARLFAFFGPLLPINNKYAIGNFMSSSLKGKTITVETKGESVRSYLHASHLASQLIYLLGKPIQGECHVGSSFAKPIHWWANYVSELFGIDYEIKGKLAEIPSFYAPENDARIPTVNESDEARERLFRSWFQWLNSH
jgi:nucleoside-diphosphate-sugar epimerase